MFTPGGLSRLEFAGLRGGGGKGGGGGSAPQVIPPIVLTDPVSGKTFVQQPGGTLDYNTGKITYTNAQDELNAEIDQRKAGEKATSDAAVAQAAADKASTKSTFDTRLQGAYDTGLSNITNYFTQQGLDPNRYMQSDIIPALNTARQSVADLDPNPMAAFSPTLGQSILNNISTGARTRADNSLTSLLPSTFADTAINYSNIDPYVGEILNSQFDPLSSQLQNANKRGTLNEFGYKAALDALTGSKTAAESQVRSIGSGIVDKDRQALNDYISRAHTTVGNMNPGALEGFDPNTYVSGARDLASRQIGTLGGDIRSSLGNTKFADLQTLLNQGGSVQGANSGGPTTPGGVGDTPLDPTLAQNQNEKRGLGTVGAF